MSFFYLSIAMFLMQIKSCEDVSVLKDLITTNEDIFMLVVLLILQLQ